MRARSKGGDRNSGHAVAVQCPHSYRNGIFRESDQASWSIYASIGDGCGDDNRGEGRQGTLTGGKGCSGGGLQNRYHKGGGLAGCVVRIATVDSVYVVRSDTQIRNSERSCSVIEETRPEEDITVHEINGAGRDVASRSFPYSGSEDDRSARD